MNLDLTGKMPYVGGSSKGIRQSRSLRISKAWLTQRNFSGPR